MSKFTRPRPTWQWPRLIIAGLVSLAIWYAIGTSRQPNTFYSDVRSGIYEIQRVGPDGSLHLVVPPANDRTMEVRWLGIAITARAEAVEWLTETIAPSSQIELRLDRRQIDEQRQLQGYFLYRDQLLNAELVRRGWAVSDSHPSDFAPIVRQIQQAQESSQNQP